MLIVMSVKPTLTDELLKVNSALKSIFSVISVVEDNEVRSEEDGTSQQDHVKVGKQTASDFIKFYGVLELFEANSGQLQIFYRLQRPLRIIKR